MENIDCVTFLKSYFLCCGIRSFSMMKIEDDFNLRCSRTERKFNFSIRIMSIGSSENSIMKSESFTRRRLNFTSSFYDDEAALVNYERRWRMRIDSEKRGIKLWLFLCSPKQFLSRIFHVFGFNYVEFSRHWNFLGLVQGASAEQFRANPRLGKRRPTSGNVVFLMNNITRLYARP